MSVLTYFSLNYGIRLRMKKSKYTRVSMQLTSSNTTINHWCQSRTVVIPMAMDTTPHHLPTTDIPHTDPQTITDISHTEHNERSSLK